MLRLCKLFSIIQEGDFFVKKKFILKCCIICFVVVCDLLTKEIFNGKTFTLIPGLIGIKWASELNYGAAYNLFSGYTPLLIVVTLVIIVFIILFDMKYKPDSKLYSVGISFVIGGAIGNLVDRIALGGVRDFIRFEFWETFPTFNVADSFLVIGVVLLVIYLLFFNKEKESKK